MWKLENGTIDIEVSNKCVKFKFWVNYPFKLCIYDAQNYTQLYLIYIQLIICLEVFILHNESLKESEDKPERIIREFNDAISGKLSLAFVFCFFLKKTENLYSASTNKFGAADFFT